MRRKLTGLAGIAFTIGAVAVSLGTPKVAAAEEILSVDSNATEANALGQMCRRIGPPSSGLGARGAFIGGIAVLLSIVVSLSLYPVHRNANYSTEFGAMNAANRVNVQVWIN